MTGSPYLPGMKGAELRRDLSQFYTPDALAARVVDWSVPTLRQLRSGPILEPSAGRGALVYRLSMIAARSVSAWEADPVNVRWLRREYGGPGVTIHGGDFLSAEPVPHALAVMNPPYEGDQDVEHILHAFRFAPVVISICRAGILHGSGRLGSFWKHVEIRRGARLASRPGFGGEHSARTDFVVLELELRSGARGASVAGVMAPAAETWEWWR